VDDAGPFDKGIWPDVFMEVIRPLIRNMRDVRRYALAVHGTVRALDGQIALPDVLALEAIRLFLPDVFASLHGKVDALTTTSTAGPDDPPTLKVQIDSLIKDAGVQGNVVRSMVERIFPAARRHIGGSHYLSDWKGKWLTERRVAHEEILRFYLERRAGSQLQAFTNAEQAWVCMADRDALDKYLRSLNRERLQDVIASLENYQDQFAEEHVVPSATVLLNLMADIPERQGGMFDLDSRLVVLRVTYRLLRSLNNPTAVETVVQQILPELKSLSAKLDLILQVGHREAWGHKLVSELVAAGFEKAWRDEVRAASIHEIVEDTNPLRVLLTTKRDSLQTEASLVVAESPELTLAVLRGSRSEVKSQAIGSSAIRRSARLDWDALSELFGDQQTLTERIVSLKATRPKGADDLLELAEKYASGWRPERFSDD
jgi:hypothetical protein